MVPFHHQHLLTKLFNQVIAKCDKEYQDFSYFNFSGIKGQIKVGKGGLHYMSHRVTIVFSSINIDFLNKFLNVLFSMSQINIGEMELQPDSIELEAPVELSTKNKYVCISPMIIVDPILHLNDNIDYIDPGSEEFSDYLYEATMLRMERSGLYTPEQISSFNEFNLVPDKNYLSKLKQNDKKFTRIYLSYIKDEKYDVRGYTFPFTLSAAPEVHEFIFSTGIGALTENGFGMLDLANLDPTKRTIKYNFENNDISSL